MSRSHILTPSWSSGAIATANSQAQAIVGADNLLFVDHSRKYRAATDNNVQVTLTASAAKPFDTVYWGYNNASATGQITITAHTSSTGLFTSPSYSFGPVDMQMDGDLAPFTEYDTIVQLGTTQTYQYIGIEIDDAANPDNFVQAGVVIVGQDFEPAIGQDVGWRFGWNDPSEVRRTLSGIAVVRAKRKFKGMSGTFPKQRNVDGMRWLAINAVYGSSIPVVAWWEPYDTGFQQYFTCYGHLQWPGGKPLTYANPAPLWDVEVEIEEV